MRWQFFWSGMLALLMAGSGCAAWPAAKAGAELFVLGVNCVSAAVSVRSWFSSE